MQMRAFPLSSTLLLVIGFCDVITALSLRAKVVLEENQITPKNAVKRELGQETNYERLETVMNGDNGSYGNMFDVQSKNEIVINALEFYCALKENVTYEVFTKSGSYLGYEESPGNWTMISNGTVLALGPNVTTPTLDFSDPLLLMSGSLQSFYITLLQPDIRYSEAEEEGSLIVEDDYLKMFTGVGVAGYPFGDFFYRPRIFNGAILYTISTSSSLNSNTTHVVGNTEAPSSAPSQNVSNLPTVLSSSETGYIIPLSFLLEHNLSDDLSETTLSIDSTVSKTLEDILQDASKTVKKIVDEHGLEIISVQSTFLDMSTDKSRSCLVSDASRTCSIVDIMVQIYHEESISKEKVRHAILSYSEEIGNELDFTKTIYIGFQTDETEISFTLTGTELTVFDNDSIILFEDTLLNYFNNSWEKFTISSAVLKSQSLASNDIKSEYQTSAEAGAKPKKRNQTNYFESMLSIVVSLKGEFLPPPQLKFGDAVSEYLYTQGRIDEFLNYLKEYPQFENIASIHSGLDMNVESIDAVGDVVATKLTLDEGASRTKWFYTLCGGAAFIMFMLAVVFGFMYVNNQGGSSSLPTGSLNYNIERFVSFRRGSSVSKMSLRRGSSKSKVSISRDSGETKKINSTNQSDEEISVEEDRPSQKRRESSSSLLWKP